LDGIDISLENDKEELFEGEGDEKKLKPQVFILSSGEMTPFHYELAFPTGSRIKIEFDAIGNVKRTLFEKE
jgi:hypothetical protein